MPLSDLTVLELASVLAGPSVGQFFAEMGATVLKVENVRTRGDVTRRWRLPSEPAEAGVSSYFACCNWGKQSVALDLQAAEGRALLHGLVRRADVVLSSYKPGAAERLGADAATLRALRPALLYAHLTGYGPDDPRPGYDAVIQAEAGFTYINGTPDGPPVKMPVALMDLLAAHQLKEALLLALLRRARTGEGATITVSLLAAAAASLANQATNYLMAGQVPQRTGSEHPNIAPYGTVFATADAAPVVLAVGTDRQFAALCGLLGLAALPTDPRFADNAARVTHRHALNALLQAQIATWPRPRLLEALAQAKVPAGAVHDLADVFAQPQAAGLVLRHGAIAGLRQAAFTFDGTAPVALTPPPPYGAHTAAVLRAHLQLDAGALQALADQDVVYCAGG